jgi:hypothetical protein
MLRQDNYNVNHAPMKAPPMIATNPFKLSECNDIAALLKQPLSKRMDKGMGPATHDLPVSLLDVSVGVAELDTEVASRATGETGDTVYRPPANIVVVPLGAKVMTGPAALMMVFVAP